MNLCALHERNLTSDAGGNAFNATMTGDIGEQGTCTTCAYSEGRNPITSHTSFVTTDFDL
jgi:hypothetical protein